MKYEHAEHNSIFFIIANNRRGIFCPVLNKSSNNKVSLKTDPVFMFDIVETICVCH